MPLYFKERSDWQYVSSLIEATLRERVKFERSWVIRACKGTKNLDEVYDRVNDFLNNKKLRSLDRSVFTNLQAYLELILPEIKRLPTTDKIEIGPGVNVMDLEAVYHRPEVQALVIRSVMEHILEVERDIIVVVPECWKFLPQTRNTPVKIFFERFIREGATIGNYLWLDSQDIAGVDKTPLRQVARGELSAQHVANMLSDLRSNKEVDDEMVWEDKYEKLKADFEEWKAKHGDKFQEKEDRIEKLKKDIAELKTKSKEFKSSYSDEFVEVEINAKHKAVAELKKSNLALAKVMNEHKCLIKVAGKKEEALIKFRDALIEILDIPSISMVKQTVPRGGKYFPPISDLCGYRATKDIGEGQENDIRAI